jgi:hypothetical protein
LFAAMRLMSGGGAIFPEFRPGGGAIFYGSEALFIGLERATRSFARETDQMRKTPPHLVLRI